MKRLPFFTDIRIHTFLFHSLKSYPLFSLVICLNLTLNDVYLSITFYSYFGPWTSLIHFSVCFIAFSMFFLNWMCFIVLLQQVCRIKPISSHGLVCSLYLTVSVVFPHSAMLASLFSVNWYVIFLWEWV